MINLALNSEVNISQFRSYYHGNSKDFKKVEEDVNYDSEDECFGLNNRKKYEKFS